MLVIAVFAVAYIYFCGFGVKKEVRSWQ